MGGIANLRFEISKGKFAQTVKFFWSWVFGVWNFSSLGLLPYLHCRLSEPW
jgi:hypothetical protein